MLILERSWGAAAFQISLHKWTSRGMIPQPCHITENRIVAEWREWCVNYPHCRFASLQPAWALCWMGIQSGLCNGINGNTQAGGAQLCSLAQQLWRASLGGWGYVCVCVCVVYSVLASRAWKQALFMCISVCMCARFTGLTDAGVHVWVCAPSRWVEAFLLIRARVSKCQTQIDIHTHPFFISWRGPRQQWCETL